MLRKILFILIVITTTSASFGQSSEKSEAIVGNIDIVKETQELVVLAENVNKTYAELSNAATGTRGSSDQAKNNYEKALADYIAALEHQLELGNSTDDESLNEEISFVKKLQAGTTKATTR